ncbi:hypothetical protein JCM10213_009121 [Rhodosporidiobolus nylandii]
MVASPAAPAEAPSAVHPGNSLLLHIPAPTDPKTGQPRSICPTCSEALAEPSALQRHMEMFHHPKKLKKARIAVKESKVTKALLWPFKARPRHLVTP